MRFISINTVLNCYNSGLIIVQKQGEAETLSDPFLLPSLAAN